ncbi:hypothetical protein EMCRGX_G011408 [Ephydatia muelleri]
MKFTSNTINALLLPTHCGLHEFTVERGVGEEQLKHGLHAGIVHVVEHRCSTHPQGPPLRRCCDYQH